MKIIFLDIDGVLVTPRTLMEHPLQIPIGEASAVRALNWIIAETGAKIVISSSWRYYGQQEMQLILCRWGVNGEVIGITPDLSQTDETGYHPSSRGVEIQRYIEEMECIGQIVILDDEQEKAPLTSFLIRTQFEIGLTMEAASRAIHILSETRESAVSKNSVS